MFLLSVCLSSFALDPDSWDISNPPFPTKEIDIDTKQGTWMSIDVHPNGKKLIFDLLGDIYEIPIQGGKAQALTSGMSWDMQPQYSHDGSKITFTSDRGGGDNIWVMDANGANLQAKTTESYRLLNSPVWSPDDQYIAARKHYTKHRSLGTGEIWLYSTQKGSGIALTQKTNDQKDVGEPHFSEDGKYIYFSKDATSGKRFEYNKDPNQQIYAIYRVVLETGKIEKVTGGSGSALRPVPSPDNRSLAFVRRIRGKTHLMIRDLNTGSEHSIVDNLDHDLQETWAIHGVYPMFSFDRQGENIFYWSDGNIWKHNLSQKKSIIIPFHVQDTRTVANAVGEKNTIEQKSFQPKMLRGVQLSPDKKQLIYETNGFLWNYNLKKKKAKRLSNTTNGHEYDPQWSSKGDLIVHCRWTDDLLSEIFLTTKNLQSKRLPIPKGHYRTPIFSPDNTSIIVRRTNGGWIRSSLHSNNTGIYQYNLKTGDWKKILSSGSNPHFGSKTHYLYYNSSRDKYKTLMRLDLRSFDTREIAHSVKATMITMAPDEQHIAFQESYNVHQVPYPPHSKSLKLSVGESSLPFETLSTNGAWNMNYTLDGSELYWTQGNTLFRHAKKTTTTSIKQSIPTDLHQKLAAITNTRIITMEDNEIIEDGTIIWKGDRIFQIGKSDSIQIPKDAYVIDGTGKTIIPGLIDVHFHGSQAEDGIVPEKNWINLSALSFGVTTLHDPSNHTSSIFAARELQLSGRILAPRIYSTGTILYGADSRSTAKVNDIEDAHTHLRRLKSVGAISVKSYNLPRRNQRQQILSAAHQEKMRVMPEGGSLMMHNLTQIVDGHTGIEHAIPVAPLYEDVLQLWGQTDVAYTPTLGVAYGGLMGEHYWYGNTDVWKNQRLNRFVPQKVLDPASRRAKKVPIEEYHHISIAESANELAKRGVRINLGAHGQREGLAAHWEMWMFAQGGMEPLEVLRAGTINGAYYLGLSHELGSLKKGKKADFLILDQNPLKDIQNTQSVSHTILNGRVYESQTMDQVFPKKEKRPPLFFQVGAQTTKEDHHTCGCGIH